MRGQKLLTTNVSLTLLLHQLKCMKCADFVKLLYKLPTHVEWKANGCDSTTQLSQIYWTWYINHINESTIYHLNSDEIKWCNDGLDINWKWWILIDLFIFTNQFQSIFNYNWKRPLNNKYLYNYFILLCFSQKYLGLKSHFVKCSIL